MCTMTAIPTAVGVRVAFNRDELRSRSEAIPPQESFVGNRRVAFPIDPDSGGTWLGVTNAGVVFALLNVNPPSATAQGSISRGTVIPSVLQANSAREAITMAIQKLKLTELAPFRLVVAGRGVLEHLLWNGQNVTIRSQDFGACPILFTSSGLGDHHVIRPRIKLFDRLMAGPPESWLAAQAEFHRHRWADRPELSVNMCRADARTVSYSIAEITTDQIRLTYQAGATDRPGHLTEIVFPLSTEVTV